MSAPDLLPSTAVPSTERVLRKLFLTMFLRGRSARGLQKKGAPQSVGQKLGLALVLYWAFGAFAFFLQSGEVFALSVYLHGMTLAFLGMFVASSAGEILFNKEEADILLHRPVTPRQLLWAKINVLVQVSFWLAGAFNFFGTIVGGVMTRGSAIYPVAHVISTAVEAVFCTGSVVLIYQLCLRWFGREKLDGLMTTAQVVMSVGLVLISQLVPRMMFRSGSLLQFNVHSWWIALLPPAWFAGFDDAVAGSHAKSSWVLCVLGLVFTGMVVWFAFIKLAQDYGIGLQKLGESATAAPKARARRRWAATLVNLPPLSWWLRNSVERASFLLCVAYLVRDRDVKLRIYPGLAPMLVMPLVFLMQGGQGEGSFMVCFSGLYIGLIPMLGLSMLQYSQNSQAADLFRVAPMPGPEPFCEGARKAVLLLLTLPLLLCLGVFGFFVTKNHLALLLLLPGVIALPVFSLVPCLRGVAVPLARPVEEGKSAGRGMVMMGATLGSMVIAGIAYWAWSKHWFAYLLAIETVATVVTYIFMKRSFAKVLWTSAE